MDVLDASQRKRCMSSIKGKNTGPEVALRKSLWNRGLRYRLKNKLPGKPDIVFPGAKLAIFVDGCFWHLCPRHGKIPGTNSDFWKTKLNANVVRDKRNNLELEQLGWHVIRIWEHEIRLDAEEVAQRVSTLVRVHSYLKKKGG